MRNRCSTLQRKTRVLCGFNPAIKGEFTRLDHHPARSVEVKRAKIQKRHFIAYSRRLIISWKIFPTRFTPYPDNLFERIVESELCKIALTPGRGREIPLAREIFIARCSIARGNQLLRGREYCRSGVLLARGVRRRSSFRAVPGIESIAGVDRYNLGTDATCPSPLP